MPSYIDILGNGIAAACCARLLQRKGFTASCASVARDGGPVLLINPSTQKLLGEVFGCGDELFDDLPTIRKRVVLWGTDSAVTLPHSGIVTKESVLLERLWRRIEKPFAGSSSCADFTIHSAASRDDDGRHRFGSRRATAVTVAIKQTAAQTCWIEALDAGWLFLLPSGESEGTLLAVGDSAAALLDRSRLVRGQVHSLLETGGTFDAYPKILDRLCGPDWLACGTAAMSFDPICGEGAGNAVREAILAAAVIRAGATDHYASRLLAGFARHLGVCREFYRAALAGPWWKAELAELERGIGWAHAQMAAMPAPRYCLTGFDLTPLRDRAS